ncbi:MAG: hypothetical protein RIQ61_1352 [Bacteroidota bacterium]|jgi:hypothetical protein
MFKFLRKIISLIFGLIILILAICEIKIPEKDIINLTYNTSYEKIAWDLNCIMHNPQKIYNSSIFIGPSWVQGGINDSILSNNGYQSLNFGVNHSGSDLDFYLVSRIVKYKPKIILLHRFPNGQDVFHPMMPLLMSPIEHFSIFKNYSIKFTLTYYPKRFYFVVKYLTLKIVNPFSLNKKYYSKFGWRSEGFKNIHLDKKNVIKILDEQKFFNIRLKNEYFNNSNILTWANFKYKYIWRYFYSNFINGNGENARVKTLLFCQLNHIKVAEIYVPHFADALYDSKFNDNQYYFKSKAIKETCYHLKNVSFLSEQKYWFDLDHFNTNGSNLFTDSILLVLPR